MSTQYIRAYKDSANNTHVLNFIGDSSNGFPEKPLIQFCCLESHYTMHTNISDVISRHSPLIPEDHKEI